MDPKNYSFAVFPFLKTSDPLAIGQLTFKSTEDTQGLLPEQASCVDEIANMLFLQNNLRIKSASYAVIPFVDLNQSPIDVEYLINVQAVVAYHYASPRHEFGDIFLSSEHASMAIFTPGQISIFLVRPDFNVNIVEPLTDLETDNHGNIDGYKGLYNFRHYFWAAKGSRLYGPMPHMTLNLSQDLYYDCTRASEKRVDYRLLMDLLSKLETRTSSRIFTALRWFNAANQDANNDDSAIVNLSIAFEALLSLPADDKTDRLTDAISLLLGRTPRVDIWARQFYDARSRIVHEGRASQLRFIAIDSRKVNEGPLYQSLLSYGRQVFQLCLGTLLVGAELAQNAGLEEKLVTNQERFQKICTLLADEKIETRKHFSQIEPLVIDIEQYKYVPESGLKIETMIGATRLAAKAFVEYNKTIPQALKEPLERLIAAKPTINYIQELDVLQELHNSFTGTNRFELTEEIDYFRIIHNLINVVWYYTFTYYYWIKKPDTNKDR